MFQYAARYEIPAPSPKGRFGRLYRWLESVLAWWMGQGSPNLLGHGYEVGSIAVEMSRRAVGRLRCNRPALEAFPPRGN